MKIGCLPNYTPEIEIEEMLESALSSNRRVDQKEFLALINAITPIEKQIASNCLRKVIVKGDYVTIRKKDKTYISRAD